MGSDGSGSVCPAPTAVAQRTELMEHYCPVQPTGHHSTAGYCICCCKGQWGGGRRGGAGGVGLVEGGYRVGWVPRWRGPWRGTLYEVQL